MAINFLVQLLIGVGLSILAYALAPKPKQPKPPTVEDIENPTVEAGRPIPVIFGSIDIKGLNVLWYGDKEIGDHESSSGDKK